MKVSFVIPVYAKTPLQLRKCLESLYAQSRNEIEVIYVFDGPDAALESVAREFDGKAILSRVIEHGGAPKARNAGAALATGDVVSFWDADCIAGPDMLERWLAEFAKPGIDFVYSGYRWTDRSLPGYDSEFFDPWLITRYNYLCSMWSLKRERVVQWDESLAGLQDWACWREVIAAGARGSFIPGYYAFSTDFPDPDSTSGKVATRKARIEAVRARFGDPPRDILVHGALYKPDAIHFAKILDTDYFWNPFYRVKDYRLAIMVGFNPAEMGDAARIAKRTIYWLGADAEALARSPRPALEQIAHSVNASIHLNFCADSATRNLLEALGIKAEIVAFPRAPEAFSSSLPEKFRVLVFADPYHREALEAVAAALPDIPFEWVEPGRNYRLMGGVSALIEHLSFSVS